MRWNTQNVLNLTDDQQYIIDQLGQIDENLGGKKNYYSATGDVPKALPNGKCDPDLVNAILDFQRFWISQGKLKVADGVIDRRGPSLRLMDQLKPLLAGSRLPTSPIIIAFGSSIMGGHANVIHAYDEKDQRRFRDGMLLPGSFRRPQLHVQQWGRNPRIIAQQR